MKIQDLEKINKIQKEIEKLDEILNVDDCLGCLAVYTGNDTIFIYNEKHLAKMKVVFQVIKEDLTKELENLGVVVDNE